MALPTPDWDGVELRWRGRLLDGSPAQGSLLIVSDAARFLDDDPDFATSIFAVPLTIPITNGEARIVVPVTDDPDIVPNGHTYTITEQLTRGQGRVIVTDAPMSKIGEGIDLNRLVSIGPSPGTPLEPITRAEFDALDYRFARLDQVSIGLDEDGVPYWGNRELIPTPYGVRADTDGVPYVHVEEG